MSFNPIDQFTPLQLIFDRVERSREDSDSSLFETLLYAGEMIAKMSVAGMVAGVQDDKDRHRYRHEYNLVRADGIGSWAQELNGVLLESTAQHLITTIRKEQRELTEKHSDSGSWQYRAVAALHNCLEVVHPNAHGLPGGIYGRQWLDYFARIRNKTRGHAAPTLDQKRKAASPLEEGIRTFAFNFNLFRRDWAYLSRNQSGRYYRTSLTRGREEDPFYGLTTSEGEDVNLKDGIHVWLGQCEHVGLVYSDVDARDYYLPNGSARKGTFETLSYITNDKQSRDLSPYLAPPGELPASETQGKEAIDLVGDTFANFPPSQREYIERPELQQELYRVLANEDRYPIVTLQGRGGIGKTSLSLRVLSEMARENQYSAILWFSARDVDLMRSGPKPVRPHVMSKSDIADVYTSLLYRREKEKKAFSNFDQIEEDLQNGFKGDPVLFVFDNFETVRSPREIYSWIDTYVRHPNKVLITTRFRDFKSDYPLEVKGMKEEEAHELVHATARKLDISDMLTGKYIRNLVRRAGGHPYVIKILLGEVAKAGRVRSVRRSVVDKDEMLRALFERTYENLLPLAKRVFLTLSSWRSVVAELAVQAVLLRNTEEPLNVSKAIEDLEKSSLIEIAASPDDGENFITVPLAAAAFGRDKLAVSPFKNEVQVDSELLQDFGAAQRTDIQHGIAPRVERLFKKITHRVEAGEAEISEYEEMLKFIARKFPPAWLRLADLYRSVGGEESNANYKRAIRRYIQYSPPGNARQKGWRRLADFAEAKGNLDEEINARAQIAALPGSSAKEVSDAANRINAIVSGEKRPDLDSDEKRVLLSGVKDALKDRSHEFNANDFSRLAWLCIHLGQDHNAKEAVRRGLEVNSANQHCLRLAKKLDL